MEQRKLGWAKFPVSVIGLGTVELGQPYGIVPAAPPSRREAIALLRYAVDRGITYVDTARSYGNAEDLIGESGVGTKPGVIIATKCGAFYENGEDPRGKDLAQRLAAEVDESLRALRRETLDLLQLHGPRAEILTRGEVQGVLKGLRAAGKVRYFGAATRGEEAAREAIRSGFFEVLQVGVSILDQRLRDQVLPDAFANGMGIVARSVYLKGVLTPSRDFLPKALDPLRARAEAVEEFAARNHLSLEEAAFRFVLSVPEVATALVGTAQRKHLDAVIAWAEKGVLPAPLVAELEAFRLDDPRLVDPKQWPV